MPGMTVEELEFWVKKDSDCLKSGPTCHPCLVLLEE